MVLPLIFILGCSSTPSSTLSEESKPSKIAYFFRAEISHRLPDGPKTFAVIGNTNQLGSIENESYLQAVRSSFTNSNHRLVPLAEKPDWIIHFSYEELPEMAQTRRDPIYAYQPGPSVFSRGSVYGHQTMTTHQGIADRVGDMQVVEHTTRTSRVGGWRIRLQIYNGASFRAGDSQPIYDARSVVTADGGSLSRVLPLVLNELFAKFPGPTTDSRERYLYI